MREVGNLKTLELINKYIMHGVLTILFFSLAYYLLFNFGLKEDVITTTIATLFGGALALVGVKLTLDYQSRQKFIEDVPIKIHNIYKLIDQCWKLKEEVGQNHFDTIPGIIDTMFEIASKVNGEVFHEVDKIRDKTLIYYYAYLNLNIDRELPDDESLDIKLATYNFVLEQRALFQHIADRLMKQYLRISKKQQDF